MIGFHVHAHPGRVTPALVEAFRALPVANVSDVMSRLPGGGPLLQQRHGGGVLSGPAVTVKTRPGDNLMIHKALDIAEPGDVIVVDADGDTTNAVVGELMVAHARYRRIAGMVIYGAIRDAAAIRAGDFPIFSTGISHRGPYKDGPGTVNAQIALSGMIIAPGDLILGDEDGIVAVPKSDAQAIHDAAIKKAAAEDKQMQQTLIGAMDRSWVDKTLRDKGCIIEVDS
ncbi:RraA family protein [Pseudohalocynthiibacter aestuariivivens]|uniref:Putative 4-hydroxy-4-methyl-2-oxoglutarate aldolase n=1 Tax=Roseovarius pelagicus TaxID=2980108 RepID=A0ABY6DFJ1_9RHOB|nr:MULTISPECIES: RraA family protein [Rhodobacterales]QIE46847.1 RraA family protein [Pseudohalocynthiibacter aestuariivivens]UXX84609.1 RraA family protein [Roseovarius pelagicus]